ncbi:hypothetical protein PMZ80_002599 [Knufia obscura]|uniref:RING-type domain-containing protein n=1 Tax=Knufia obscura TaxID=1635080 RepID=A0ABR0RYS4_9EURO|nr:hypothetical protein PMZ80_002599 [Knufia obscura]
MAFVMLDELPDPKFFLCCTVAALVLYAVTNAIWKITRKAVSASKTPEIDTILTPASETPAASTTPAPVSNAPAAATMPTLAPKCMQVPAFYVDIKETVGSPLRPGEECSHCRMEIGIGDETLTHIMCRYSWHAACLMEWLVSEMSNGRLGSCPYCRKSYVAGFCFCDGDEKTEDEEGAGEDGSEEVAM